MPADPADLDRRNWSRAKPGSRDVTPLASSDDVVLLQDKERRLAAIEEDLEDDIGRLDTANDAAAQAKCAWEGHFARVTLQLAADGIKTSEQQRRAIAMESPAGQRMYYEMVGTEATASSLRTAMRTKADCIGALQTLIRGLRTATGIDP